jgi:hypothetical protein
VIDSETGSHSLTDTSSVGAVATITSRATVWVERGADERLMLFDAAIAMATGANFGVDIVR